MHVEGCGEHPSQAHARPQHALTGKQESDALRVCGARGTRCVLSSYARKGAALRHRHPGLRLTAQGRGRQQRLN